MELTPAHLRQHPALYLDATELDDAPGALIRVRYQPIGDNYAVTLTFLHNGSLEWDEEVAVFATFADLCAIFPTQLQYRPDWQATSVVTNTPYWS